MGHDTLRASFKGMEMGTQHEMPCPLGQVWLKVALVARGFPVPPSAVKHTKCLMTMIKMADVIQKGNTQPTLS